MSDKPELPPTSQAQVKDQSYDDRGETSNATQETGVNSKSELACDQLDRESLRLLRSLSPNNSLWHPPLRSLGEGPASTQNQSIGDVGSGSVNAHDENVAITPLSSSQDSQEQPKEGSANCSHCESAVSSDEESVHKPVEATDTPTGGTSALVPSSSPPKSNQYLKDLAKILNTYVDIPSQGHVDPADQHRNVNTGATKKVKRQLTSAQSRDRNNEAIMEPIEGNFLCSILRDKVVKSISKTLLLSEFPLRPFTVNDIKVCCSLHPPGLDEDREGHKSMTVTTTILLPHKTNIKNLLNETNCKITLSVSTYDGEISKKKEPIGHSSTCRELTDEDHKNRELHMTVHQVASQEDIIFKTASDKIGFKFNVKIEAG